MFRFNFAVKRIFGDKKTDRFLYFPQIRRYPVRV